MRRLFVALLSVIPFLFFVLPASSAQAVTRHPATSVPTASYAHPHLMAAVVSEVVRARPGSSLCALSDRIWGTPKDWPVLWWDNKSKIPNPDDLRAGLRLRYGHWDYVRPWLRHRADAAIPKPAPAPPATSSSGSAPGPSAGAGAAAPVSTGGFSSFEACVISRESGGNPTAVNPTSGAGGLFQFLPSTWAALGFAASYPGGAQTAPAGVQEAAFSKLYAEAGTSPWAPYDGC